MGAKNYCNGIDTLKPIMIFEKLHSTLYLLCMNECRFKSTSNVHPTLLLLIIIGLLSFVLGSLRQRLVIFTFPASSHHHHHPSIEMFSLFAE